MIRKMNNKKRWWVLIFLFSGITAFSQCNYQLVEKAAQLAGSNTVFVRDFRVRLSDASMDDPVPSGRFPVYLNEGVNYRFTIANAVEYDGKAWIELSRRGQLFATNMTDDSTYVQNFDFLCERSATYQLQVNFGQGLEGCSAIALSMIINDSLNHIKPSTIIQEDKNDVIYLWSQNQIQIATTLGKNYVVHANVSQGRIEQKGSFFSIYPENLGSLELVVRVTSTRGEFMEGDTLEFEVEYPPHPQVILPKQRLNSISLRDFVGFGDITLHHFNDEKIYDLKQFSISTSPSELNNEIRYNTRLSRRQIEMIKQLKPGESFYITNVEFIDPDGIIHRVPAQQVFVTE
ncbi:MAG TPA: hypothetical protein DDX98_02365 [Bacteroidales bacterium]|jgi:hypothetical protein|nr:hypothetical protein [Bacteroidales bacterium]